jgi:hypothetical protein
MFSFALLLIKIKYCVSPQAYRRLRIIESYPNFFAENRLLVYYYTITQSLFTEGKIFKKIFKYELFEI